MGALAGVVRRRAVPPRSDSALQQFRCARGVRAERAATRVQKHQCRRAARQPGFRHRRRTVRPNVAWVQAVALGREEGGVRGQCVRHQGDGVLALTVLAPVERAVPKRDDEQLDKIIKLLTDRQFCRPLQVTG